MNAYNPKIYEPQKTSKDKRFVLGTLGKKPLIVIGLNPSTADDIKPDQTISKVMGFAGRHECDSFIMLNLYAQRTPYTANLHSSLNKRLHTDNISHIAKILKKHKDASILAAWSEKIEVRDYLKRCLFDIYNLTKSKKQKWLKIGFTTKGHPKHPSRAAYKKLITFDIERYITILN